MTAEFDTFEPVQEVPVLEVTDASARESFMYAQLAVRGIDPDAIGTALTVALSEAWDAWLATKTTGAR